MAKKTSNGRIEQILTGAPVVAAQAYSASQSERALRRAAGEVGAGRQAQLPAHRLGDGDAGAARNDSTNRLVYLNISTGIFRLIDLSLQIIDQNN